MFTVTVATKTEAPSLQELARCVLGRSSDEDVLALFRCDPAALRRALAQLDRCTLSEIETLAA